MPFEGVGDEVRPLSGLREVTDPRAMRALAHPVRLALLELLTIEGPLTATEASERLGESPAACSFHLRQLAKYGFVREAGGGRGRRRPWQLTEVGFRFTDVHDSSETRQAATVLHQVLVDRQLARYHAWLRLRSTYPREWQETTGSSEYLLFVTPAELRAIDADVTAVLNRHARRLTDPAQRPAGALPVEVLLFAYPFERPQGA